MHRNDPGKKLLLSSVCQPFGPKHGDGFGASFDGANQVMWAQGMFTTRATSTQWGIDFIAENLETPTVTLHYPTMSRFIAEVRKGYDFIGIAFVPATLHKMIAMSRAVREHAPTSRIVLGSYGTALGELIEPYGDHVCRGEGVEFMRRLLDERPDAPLVQPDITQVQSLFSMPVVGPTGYVFAGLGCPHGCDFCATSHYFNRRHIRLLPDGQSILHAMQRLRTLHPGMVNFYISDEDFLLNRDRGEEFLSAIRRSGLPAVSLSCFSSVKALSQFKISQLVEMGIDFVWVGFEGRRAEYSKMKGRSYEDLFKDLHDHGISVLASMIIGFDYQTPEIIEEEFEELMSLRPSLSQFLIYGPAYGTPLFEKLKQEGRLIDERITDPRHLDGFSLVFEHPHIEAEEMSAIQRRLYRQEFERQGPSIFRIADDWLAGHRNLGSHGSSRVRDKALKYGEDAHRLSMLISPSRRYLNRPTGALLDILERRSREQTGPLNRAERLAARILPALLRYSHLKEALGVDQQPDFTRRTFRMKHATRRPRVASWMRPLRLEPI